MAHQMLYQSKEYWEKMKEISRHLARTSISRVEVGAFVDAMFPDRLDQRTGMIVKSTGKEKVLELMEVGRGSDIPGVRGSKWGAFQALTEYIDHERNIRNGASRWERSVFGTGSADRQKALDLLIL